MDGSTTLACLRRYRRVLETHALVTNEMTMMYARCAQIFIGGRLKSAIAADRLCGLDVGGPGTMVSALCHDPSYVGGP